MFKLDNNFLTNLGLGSLPVDEKNKLLQAIYERLEMNVGMRLAEKMTDAQLDEFEGFIDRNDEAGALRWLESNFPNYKQVVAEELEKLKNEVAASAPQILAAAQGAPVNSQPPTSQPPMEQPQGFQQPQQPPAQPQFAPPAETGQMPAGMQGQGQPDPYAAFQQNTPPAPTQPDQQPSFQQPFTQPAAPPQPQQQPQDFQPPQPPTQPDPSAQPWPPQSPSVPDQPSAGQGQFQPPIPGQQPPAGPPQE